jgi:arylsulfatase A-like enzyme
VKALDTSESASRTGDLDRGIIRAGNPIRAQRFFAFTTSILWSAWFGVIAGFAELGVLLVRNYLTGGVALGKLQMNRHFTWMVPVSNGMIFLVAGFALGALGFLWPRMSNRLRPHVLCFMTFLALFLMIPGLFVTAPIALAGGFALVVGRRIALDAQGFGRRVARSLPCFLVGLASLSAWVSGNDSIARESVRTKAAALELRPPNVLLIVMDTVRAQSLSLHGYRRDTTPNLVRLAQRAIHFEQARATAPWTLPSHASMFTGRWPHDLNVGETVPLDSTHPTLAEFLRRRGYATGGFVANAFFCNAWYGLGRGFERYEDFYGDEVVVSLAETLHSSRLGHGLLAMTGHPLLANRRRKDAARINRDFLNWLATVTEAPFFGFLNYFDAHEPYVPPDGFEHRFAPRPFSATDLATLATWNTRTRDQITKRDAALAGDAYDDCIAYIDQELGRLIDELERRGILNRTLLIITSDHGESMGEHGFFGHGKSLYNTEVHVPLLIIPPGGLTAGLSIREPVTLRDLPATVADLLDATKDSPFPGASLSRFWVPGRLERSLSDGPVVSEVSIYEKGSQSPNVPPAWRGRMSSLVADGKTLIRNADRSEELFEVYDDPAQFHNLADSPARAPIHARLSALLDGVCPEVRSK